MSIGKFWRIIGLGLFAWFLIVAGLQIFWLVFGPGFDP
jgi:hypothetical protein